MGQSKYAKRYGKPLISVRMGWQTIKMLDMLAQMEGTNRNRLINRAVMLYAEDWVGARRGVPAESLRNRLRLINILQKRIEVNLRLQDHRILNDLERDRLDILEEAYRYARYARNKKATMLLARVSDWLTETFEEQPSDQMMAKADQLRALLEELIAASSVNPTSTKGEA